MMLTAVSPIMMFENKVHKIAITMFFCLESDLSRFIIQIVKRILLRMSKKLNF